MPRARSICLISRCTSLSVRDGRCVTHAPPARSWNRTSVRNQERNRTWDRRIRPRALARDGFACVHCGAREKLEVDHIVPIAKGGTWELSNAQTLCRPCHLAKTAKDRRSKP
ncbi:HNH endonuclease [Streptomyces wuyuanensis]|uniref:HNH endonuclease n=1 Tax=Streptomyces wuyuanensis TaxID=1196353 RepID=UPI00343D430F